MFTEDEIASLAEIVEWSPIDLSAWLESYFSRYSASVVSRVRDYISSWDDLKDTDDLSLEPKESNFGVRLKSGTSVKNLQYRVCLLLELPVPRSEDWTKLVRA